MADFNGTTLPTLPTSTLPYVTIIHMLDTTAYRAIFSTNAMVVREVDDPQVMTWNSSDDISVYVYTEGSSTDWSVDESTDYVYVGDIWYYETYYAEWVWSNTDILDENGAIIYDNPDAGVITPTKPASTFDLRSWLAMYLMGRCGTRVLYPTSQPTEDSVVLGATWATAKSFDISWPPTFCYCNGRAFAVTYDNYEVYASEDGETWDLISTLPGYPSNLTCANGLILWTIKNTVYCSSDFVSWTATELTLDTTDSFDELVYGDGRFLLVPNNQLDPMFYSDDGTNWTQLASKIGSLSGGINLSYLNGRWYSTWEGSNSTTASVFHRSDDGISWTRISSVVGTVNSPIYTDGLYVIPVKKASYDEKTKDYYYSTDGVSWTAGTIFGNLTKPVTLQYAGGLWFAYNYEYLTYYSADGINWNPTNLTDTLAVNITYENGVFVTSLFNDVGYCGIAYSYDGITWTQAYTTDKRAYFEYKDGVFIAYGDFGILCSVDGASWTQSNITEYARVFNAEDVGLIGFSNSSLIYPVKN